MKAIAAHDITFGIGPAGTGKTYLAVAGAVDALERDTVQRIVLTRPAVEAGERLGFLPGDLAQKIDPYLRPLYDALYDLIGFDKTQKLFEKQAIEIAPLAYMRGRTLNNAFIILDEAQNTTPEQIKMFLTRIGFGSRAVITGDVTQIDLPRGQKSGLVEAQPGAREGPRHRLHALHERRRRAAPARRAHRRGVRGARRKPPRTPAALTRVGRVAAAPSASRSPVPSQRAVAEPRSRAPAAAARVRRARRGCVAGLRRPPTRR